MSQTKAETEMCFSKMRFVTTICLSIWLNVMLVVPSHGQRFNSIPVSQTPSSVRVLPKANHILTDPSRLRRNKPAVYRLDQGDTLAVFVEGVLGELDSNPPVQFPTAGSDLPPSIGVPVPVLSDGTISLPQVPRFSVRGLTVLQVEALIKRAYLGGDDPLLKKDNRIIVSLMQKRTYSVTVVRQDQPSQSQVLRQNRSVTTRSDRSSRVEVLQLTADENDVFNALVQSGGLPGVNAEPNVRVQQTTRYRPLSGNGEFARSGQGGGGFPRSSAAEFPRSGRSGAASVGQNYSTIPLRQNAGSRRGSTIRSEDVTLRDGAIVRVQSRGPDVYYTGGLLGGGEFPLPRDTDLDVTQAVAIAGGNLGGGSNGQLAATDLTVLRRLSGNRQIAIGVDLRRALVDRTQRILVAPGDTLILRRTPAQNLGNLGIGIFNTNGLRQLLR